LGITTARCSAAWRNQRAGTVAWWRPVWRWLRWSRDSTDTGTTHTRSRCWGWTSCRPCRWTCCACLPHNKIIFI
jgi:hypothetical protein